MTRVERGVTLAQHLTAAQVQPQACAERLGQFPLDLFPGQADVGQQVLVEFQQVAIVASLLVVLQRQAQKSEK